MIRRIWKVNGRRTDVAFEMEERLLDVLRERLELTGTKEGCAEGECGACSVLIDGQLELSCLRLAVTCQDGTELTTVEGLGFKPLGRRIQNSFLTAGAVQCGYCTPGMLLASYALLVGRSRPVESEIRRALAGNLCRCTGYQRIVKAVTMASLDSHSRKRAKLAGRNG